jgi:hypothetical protein
MRNVLIAAAVILAMVACSNAKVLPGQQLPAHWDQLRNADSFSVDCRNVNTGVIDRETVDVDAGTVTVEIPGAEPVVHRIIQFAIEPRPVVDRFDQPSGWDMPLAVATWARAGSQNFGLLLTGGVGGPRQWSSAHEDGSLWMCADPD